MLAPGQLEEKLQEMCLKDLNLLELHGLITLVEGFDVKPTSELTVCVCVCACMRACVYIHMYMFAWVCIWCVYICAYIHAVLLPAISSRSGHPA